MVSFLRFFTYFWVRLSYYVNYNFVANIEKPPHIQIMDSILIISVLSFFVAFTAIPVVIKIAKAKKLFDIPCERKIHKDHIASLGGIGIFIGLIFSICIFIPFTQAPWMQYFIASSLIVFFLGLKDDLILISPMKKFVGQLLATFLIANQSYFKLTSAYGFLGITELHPLLSVVFTFLTIIIIINAFNLIDGVDGLAGFTGLISTLFFGVVFLIEKDIPFASLAFSMSAALVAFLFYNITPAKIFMGDTGSLLLGLVNAVLALHFINLETAGNTFFQFKAAPAMAFAVIFIPLIDTIRVFLIRLYHGKSPFSPDQNHLHHILLKRGYPHIKITLILGFCSIFSILFAFIAQPLGINFVIFSLFGIGLTAIGVFQWVTNNDRFKGKRLPLSVAKQDLQSLSAKVITVEGDIKNLEVNN